MKYGLIGGIGLGIGYIAPVSTLVEWFPDHRGLATGLAIMGFGFASLISGPAGASLVNSVDISNAFYILGACYFIVMFAIVSCYGDGFSSVPAYIGDVFGTKQLGAIHGYI